MSWADFTYGVWALVGAGALCLWLAASRGWRVGRTRVGRPGALLSDAFDYRPWLRLGVLAGWVWVGVHAFAR